ncbi:class I SAM-dependent methyltransferase [Tahibacter amnicola]|uniref:Class I SAM-dependent methyltransferase n=1 Tax=Tahibacter amnicola TaxID=2976241 RepID=A0ABY6BCT9_9GAMM|nr:class I SAM-dependent methyltransferase [Tahibacter amnicola]UXI67357.1 class I SAM-dependent methyltransferase [Tahibacter amnicola]
MSASRPRRSVADRAALERHGSGSEPLAYDAAAYGERCALFYDEIYPKAPRQAIDRLTTLAGDRAVLEAGVGTGRFAIALAQRGLSVTGVDASAAMLAALHQKPGAAGIQTVLGDFTTLQWPARFGLVTCLVDTLALLPDAARQAAAINRLAAALEPGGFLVVETMVIDSLAPSSLHADIPVDSRHGRHRYRVDLCPVAYDALDAWVAAAGLALSVRWCDWNGRPWQGQQGNLISIFTKPQRDGTEPSR